ncbi:MAG: DNA-binding protein WhiA [Ruminococcaceae bacterium]|nr:DNA-binding protein WhiA [Oscillospiraceae bacterium]
MSFSYKIKKELSQITNIKPCCSLAEMYGLLLFGKTFSKREMYINTENEFVADKYYSVAARLSDGKVTKTKSPSGKYRVSVDDEKGRLNVLKAFDLDGTERSRKINHANLSDMCCFNAFIRGVFLACGTINDPEKSYHLEFCVPYSLKNGFLKIIEETGLQAKEIKRNNSYYLYFKGSEDILTLFAIMGANDAVLEYTGVKIFKDIRNNTNRKMNFENANLDRTIDAAYKQNAAILKLKKEGKFQKLPPELKELAQLRLENPELSLKEIGELLDPPMSRSGVNHRFQKIIEYAE